VHYVLTVKRIYLGAYTSKYLNQEGNYGHFSAKSTNDRVLRVVGLVSGHTTVCTMFCSKMQQFGRVNVEISQSGRKLRTFFDNIV
jgi:hypothetical protein